MKKMKKEIFYILGLIILVSCENSDDVTIKYSLKATINGLSLVENLTDPYDDDEFFPDGDVASGYNVRTKYLIYDEDGSLVKEDSLYSDSFSDEVSFSETLEQGTYTVVTIMDIVSDDGTFWDCSNCSNIENAKITMGNYVPNWKGVLGYSKEQVLLNEKKDISITPTHLGALYVIHFSNIDNSTIRYVYYNYDLQPNTFQIYTEMYKSLEPLEYAWGLWNDYGIYTGYYTYAYLLPTDELDLKFTLYDEDLNAISTTYAIPLEVVAGEHKLLTIDLAALTFGFSTLTEAQKTKSPTISTSNQNEINIDELSFTTKNRASSNKQMPVIKMAKQ
jgi:hypothetical protein